MHSYNLHHAFTATLSILRHILTIPLSQCTTLTLPHSHNIAPHHSPTAPFLHHTASNLHFCTTSLWHYSIYANIIPCNFILRYMSLPSSCGKLQRSRNTSTLCTIPLSYHTTLALHHSHRSPLSFYTTLALTLSRSTPYIHQHHSMEFHVAYNGSLPSSSASSNISWMSLSGKSNPIILKILLSSPTDITPSLSRSNVSKASRNSARGKVSVIHTSDSSNHCG